MLKLPRLVPLVAMACLLALPSVASADSLDLSVMQTICAQRVFPYALDWGRHSGISNTPRRKSRHGGNPN